MIENRVDKLIVKAFLESPVPALLAKGDPALCERAGAGMKSLSNRLLMSRDGAIDLKPNEPLTKEDKAAISNIISLSPPGSEKNEMVQYYRLLVLTEAILYRYKREYP